MSNRLVARVSVLDLDNSVRFSRQTSWKTEETVLVKGSHHPKDQHQTEIHLLLKEIKQC